MSEQLINTVENGTVTSARGFTAGSTYAGLKTYGQDKLDLGILASDKPSAVAGVFTRSKIVSSTVTLTRQRVQSGRAQAVIVNSGCANACVGPQGMVDAMEMASLAADKLGMAQESVLVASTGVIGVEIPMSLIRPAIDKIEMSPDGGHSFARAIMTTDTHPKEVAVSFEIDGKRCTLGAAAKGVGMIHPDMATMLCFVGTDAAVEPGFLQSTLGAAADSSFNMLTIDGDTSTNDLLVVLANGDAGNKPIRAETPEAELFQQALSDVCQTLTRMIARDGEGATKLIDVTVEGAASAQDARKVARTVVSSPLVKTAVHGADPNWGRLMMAIGRSGAEVQEDMLALYLNGICMFDAGAPIPFHKDLAVLSMKESDVKIIVRLGLGEHSATAWGCDLTEEYVRFNSEYTT